MTFIIWHKLVDEWTMYYLILSSLQTDLFLDLYLIWFILRYSFVDTLILQRIQKLWLSSLSLMLYQWILILSSYHHGKCSTVLLVSVKTCHCGISCGWDVTTILVLNQLLHGAVWWQNLCLQASNYNQQVINWSIHFCTTFHLSHLELSS